jgi:tetratricopeptide (TPR) repeat protein
MSVLLTALVLVQSDTDLIQDLKHIDPVVRFGALRVILGKKKVAAILPMIELLRDESNSEVRDAAVEALRRLTGQTTLTEYAKWREWWDTDGVRQYPREVIKDEEIMRLLQPHLEDFRARLEKAKTEINDTKRDNRFLSVVTMAVVLLFFLVMLFFVGHVSSRIKAWKELVSKAEVYVSKSEEITKRTDQILAELESKKADLMTFLTKAREDSEGEVERYSDMLQKNLEHRMREEMMGLRQKAEKELEQTLGELRAQVDVEIRRVAGDQKEKSEKQFQEQRDRFLKEVQAHTLFLDASFYSIHGKPEEAVRRYRQLVALKPDHLQAWNNLGTVYRELVRYDESLDAIQRALDLAPSDATVLYNLAATYARQRKKDKMLDALTRAIANDGEYKDEALNDPAFRDYWNDPAFKDVAEG